MERAPFLEYAGTSGAHSVPSDRVDRQWLAMKQRICNFYSLFAIAAAILVFIFLQILAAANKGSIGGGSHATSVYNSTLGFGAVILLSLPERTDRRDAVSLIAARSGIQITKFIEATRGEDVHPKARPYGHANGTVAEGYIGSWRTHMDALKYIIDNRLESALLLEDDVDWDIRIKSQLATFSEGLKTSVLHDKSSIPISSTHPYGNDWDLMHLGAVIIKPPPAPFDTLMHTYVDAERPRDPGCWSKDERNPMFCWSKLLEKFQVPDDSRAILPSHSITGLPALAVTYEGAQRILWELSLNKLDFTLDWSIYDLLNRGRIKGWTVLPPLFGMWKMGGPADSDLLSFGNALHPQKDGESPGLEQSARQALNDEFTIAENRWTGEYWQRLGINLPSTVDALPAEADPSNTVPR